MFANETQQQISALVMSTLAFAACFAVWTLFSVIGIEIKSELSLSETEFGVLVATPILTGALARLPMGVLVERVGGRRLMLVLMLLVSLPLYGLSIAETYSDYLLIGLGIGLSGSSFIVGIHYVSSWSNSDNQGLTMGIFGAGSLGAALTNLVAPLIILAYGWRQAPVVYAFVLILVALMFWMMTSDDPKHNRVDAAPRYSLAEQLSVLWDLRVWRFGLYYFVVFGGYVALALWLPDYYVTHYGLDLTTASFLTMLFTLPGALTRIFGGWCADRLGARHVNWTVFWVCLVCLFFLSYPPTTMTIHGIERDVTLSIAMPVWLFTVLVMVVGIAMGFGTASVYRVIYDYYPERIGVVGGMVGALGAIGGFALPIMFGLVADVLGVRSSCFMLLYGLLAVCMMVMFYSVQFEEQRKRWRDAVQNNFLNEGADFRDS
ncbi:MAG: nitrate/nitrite transporter [Amphritea sp.]